MFKHSLLFLISTSCIVALSTAAYAQTFVVADEDFEDDVATGWSRGGVVTTEADNPVFTKFLGRFFGPSDLTRTTSKTFDLPGDQTEVVIQFDFYEIDSWDVDETFSLFIDDNPIPVFVDRFFEARFDDPELATPLQPGPSVSNHGFTTRWPDQTYRYDLVHATTADTLKLTFHFGLDSGPGDESAGLDNVFITADSGPVVPVPSAAWAGVSLLGALGGYRTLHKRTGA